MRWRSVLVAEEIALRVGILLSASGMTFVEPGSCPTSICGSRAIDLKVPCLWPGKLEIKTHLKACSEDVFGVSYLHQLFSLRVWSYAWLWFSWDLGLLTTTESAALILVVFSAACTYEV
ncbi:hypothetical protein GOP47_0013708 [Adiantum capillus-veneris]|uniref:Secreted protein n=1 Tax=Adiantum capillus-veneris TaxID=13818 RepID=A0A9D4UQ01_ADICA|nr:hypothetical protein GOP47_0013708 [Adiantum capillus-veneris]